MLQQKKCDWIGENIVAASVLVGLEQEVEGFGGKSIEWRRVESRKMLEYEKRNWEGKSVEFLLLDLGNRIKENTYGKVLIFKTILMSWSFPRCKKSCHILGQYLGFHR